MDDGQMNDQMEGRMGGGDRCWMDECSDGRRMLGRTGGQIPGWTGGQMLGEGGCLGGLTIGWAGKTMGSQVGG